MKKLFIAFFILFFSISVFSNEITLGAVKCAEIKDEHFYERDCRLRYDGKYYLQINSPYTTSWIDLSESQLESLRNTMKKFQEWKKIAKDNKTDVRKEIPNSEIKSSVSWSTGRDFYVGVYNITLTFSIATIDKGADASLILTSSRVPSTENRYIDFETGYIIFLSEVSDEFQAMLAKENIEKALKESKEDERKVDQLFQ